MLAEIAKDIVKRPFILVGFTGLPAADAAGRHLVQPRHQALGARRWQALHRLVYADRRAGPCCTSSGCAPARTTLPKWRSMPLILAALLGWRVRQYFEEKAAPARAQSCVSSYQNNSRSAARRRSRAAHLVGGGFARRGSGGPGRHRPAPRRRGRGCCSCWPCSCNRRRPTARPAVTGLHRQRAVAADPVAALADRADHVAGALLPSAVRRHSGTIAWKAWYMAGRGRSFMAASTMQKFFCSPGLR